MRAPAVPLITVDPYFSVWSKDENLNYAETMHWTGAPNSIIGYVSIDGLKYSFFGYHRDAHKLTQTSLEIDALTTKAKFANDKIELTASFMTPLLPDDLKLLSRPVSYLGVSWKSLDGADHDVSVEVRVREDLCLNRPGQSPVVCEKVEIEGVSTVRMGNSEQNVLNRSGDDLRIDWGYIYLSVVDPDAVVGDVFNRRQFITAKSVVPANTERLFLFAYDDIESIRYFGDHLKSAWNNDGKTIEQAISEAAKEYDDLKRRANRFSVDMYTRALADGGQKYAEIVSLAYRQTIAAHKVVIDKDGEVLFISKECFSNGCAATVDVSYPSMPLFLIYNPELVKGMMRPIYKFNDTKQWKYDFAPHDAGQYPLVDGQVYGLNRETGELALNMQMPVEECGNMLIMEANVALAENSAAFAESHIKTLINWCKYLIKFGSDPENQLCTDDFAGHLAHNCNLSLKAVMGIQAMSIIMNMLGREKEARKYRRAAVNMARNWCKTAVNEDGSYRLAFDQPDTFSMKYNMVWDKIWGTRLFPNTVVKAEIASNLKHMNKYGMPLDSRSDYTKSDWLVWTATLANSQRDFEKFISPLWKAYDESSTRVPMTDWYDTVSACKVGFQHRSVQGGLYIKILEASQKLKVEQ